MPNCIVCDYHPGSDPDSEYDGIIGAICPECNWEVDHLDEEDNYYSGANGAFLDVWIENYLSNKKKKEKLARQNKAKQETAEFNNKVMNMTDKEAHVIEIFYSLRNEYFSERPNLSLMEYVFHRVKMMVESKEIDYEQFYWLMQSCCSND